MLDSRDLDACYTDIVYPFYCLGCEEEYANLSTLFKHLEPDHCGHTVKPGTIKHVKGHLFRHLGD